MRKLITFIIFLVAVLTLFRLYTRFKVTAAPIPPGVYLGGLALSDLKETDEIREHLDRIYEDPLQIDFADEELVLRPHDIDFHLNVALMVAEAGQYLQGPSFIDIAWRAALGFPQKRRDITVNFTYNQAKLRAWLATAAIEHNRKPIGAHALPPLAQRAVISNSGAISGTVASSPATPSALSPNAWRWAPGIPGYALDIEKSIKPVIDALSSQQKRVARLALIETAPPQPSMADLTQVLSSTLSTFPGFAAIYVRDLQKGVEATVDADVAFSGMATLKLALAAAMLAQENSTNSANGQRIDLALYEVDNQAANQLLSALGNGDLATGAQKFTDFMRSLGFVNTYLQNGFEASPLPQLATPANQRKDWNTKPDPNRQTTPADLGRLLAAIYECTQGKGILIQSYPGDFTADSCRHLLFYISHDQFQDLIWAGLPQPQKTWIVHKHARAAETHGDIALIWGPTGPYVLSVFLYQANWLDLKLSSDTMQTVSRLTWDFFALQKTQGSRSASTPPELKPPPGYSAIDNYVPTMANPTGQ